MDMHNIQRGFMAMHSRTSLKRQGLGVPTDLPALAQEQALYTRSFLFVQHKYKYAVLLLLALVVLPKQSLQSAISRCRFQHLHCLRLLTQ